MDALDLLIELSGIHFKGDDIRFHVEREVLPEFAKEHGIRLEALTEKDLEVVKKTKMLSEWVCTTWIITFSRENQEELSTALRLVFLHGGDIWTLDERKSHGNELDWNCVIGEREYEKITGIKMSAIYEKMAGAAELRVQDAEDWQAQKRAKF